jgi:Ca2+:H+ antiporter
MCKLLSPEFLPTTVTTADAPKAILLLSRGSAIVLLLIYSLFLFFRLRSHSFLWQANDGGDIQDDDDDDRLPKGLFVAYLLVLAIIFTLSIFCAAFLIDSIPSLVAKGHLTNTFTGLVILPIITHLCKYIKTGVIAYHGHSEIAVAMTLGSSVDVSFFTLPVLVLVGWLIGQPMTMEFQLLETIIVVLSILVMAGFVMDGKSNYLEGSMSLGL